MKGDKFITRYGRKMHIEGGDGISLCFRAWTSWVKPGREVKPDTPICVDCFRMSGQSGSPVYIKPRLTKWGPLINLKGRKGKLFYETARLMRWNSGL